MYSLAGLLTTIAFPATCMLGRVIRPFPGLVQSVRASRTAFPLFTVSGVISYMSSMTESKYDYDLVVIGGGSGGLAASKEAAKANPDLKVAVLDYVVPSVQGTKWGLGGTCVNVGCIPKKLMHYSAILGHKLEDAKEFGWSVDRQTATHDWPTMVTAITDYIRMLNFSYRTGLRSAGVTYINGYAKFVDEHTINWKGIGKNEGTITAEKFIIATGGRPTMGNVPGNELCLSSDDLFWRKQNPGKTLVIGAGYIALECAGFLHGIGNDVTVMVRGQFMRKFDQQVAGQVGELMERRGIRFLMPASCTSFVKANKAFQAADGAETDASGVSRWEEKGKIHQLYPSGALQVTDPSNGKVNWKFPEGPIRVEYNYNDGPLKGHTAVEEFDTVLMATGRTACVQDLDLDKAGVFVNYGKVLVDENEATTTPHIYAIGDVATGIKQHSVGDKRKMVDSEDRPELTPVAIQAGQLLARRLYKNVRNMQNDGLLVEIRRLALCTP